MSSMRRHMCGAPERNVISPACRAFKSWLCVCIAALPAMVLGADGQLPAFPSNFSADVRIALDQALPISQDASHTQRCDIRIDLRCRDGRWDTNGSAWFREAAWLDHAVRGVKAETKEDRLRVELSILFQTQPPALAGGSAEYSIDLERNRGILSGSFTGIVTAVPDRERTEAWARHVGKEDSAKANQAWTARVASGAVAGAHPAGRPAAAQPESAYGVILPVRSPPEGFVPPGRGEHPRLFFRKSALADLKAEAKTDWGAQCLERLKAAADRKDRDGKGIHDRAAGCAGAAWVLLGQVANEPSWQENARIAISDSLRLVTAGKDSPAIAREVAGLALAYDCCQGTDALPPEVLDRLNTALKQFALRIAALDPPKQQDMPMAGKDRLAGDAAGPDDYRFAALRAAAGLALLAADPGGETSGNARDAAVLWRAAAGVERSIERFLATGIGERGAGTGNYGFYEMMELVFPYLQAHLLNTGINIGKDTGAEWVPVMATLSRGLCFNRGTDIADEDWFPFTAFILRKEHAWLTSRRAAQSRREPADPWAAALAFINRRGAAATNAGPAPAKAAIPLAYQDRRMGTVVMRSGWDDPDAFVTIFEAGSGASQAAELRGNLSVYGLGHEWIARFVPSHGSSDWPLRRNQNVIRLADRGAELVPATPGSLRKVRLGRDGSGSANMAADNEGLDPHGSPKASPIFRLVSPQGDQDGGHYGQAKAWRTVGVDYSGASGAPALIAIVEADLCPGAPSRFWEITIGQVPRSEVELGRDSFVVRPGGTGASMKGTILYPGNLEIKYVEPTALVPGRITAWLNKPIASAPTVTKNADDLLVAADDVGEDALATDKEVKRRAAEAAAARTRLEMMSQLIHKSTPSPIAVGSDESAAVARNACVVILTVQKGAPPEVVSARSADGFLAKVGDQTVYYRDRVVSFEKKRDAGRSAAHE